MKKLWYMSKEEMMKELYKYYLEEANEYTHDYETFKALLNIQFTKADMVLLLANKRSWKGINI